MPANILFRTPITLLTVSFITVLLMSFYAATHPNAWGGWFTLTFWLEFTRFGALVALVLTVVCLSWAYVRFLSPYLALITILGILAYVRILHAHPVVF